MIRKALPLILALIPLSAFAASPEYPDAAYSHPPEDHLHHFETLCGLYTSGGNAYERAGTFEYFELELIQDAGETKARWAFKFQPDAEPGAAIALHKPWRQVPESVTVDVKNLSGQPLQLAGFFSEMQWIPKQEDAVVTWVAQGDAPVPPGEERTVRFEMAQATPPQPSKREQPIAPLTFSLHIPGLEQGAECELLLSDLVAHFPHAAELEVTRFDAPEAITAGEAMRFTLETSGPTADRALAIEVRDGKHVLWRTPLSAEETAQLTASAQAHIDREAPWYLPTRDLTAGLVADDARVAGPEAQLRCENTRDGGFPRVARREHNGRPTVFVNDEPLLWHGYASYEWQPGGVAEFGASGVNVFCVPVNAGAHVHQIGAPTWRGPDDYDFSDMDEDIAIALQANPDAYLLLRTSLTLPPFWVQDHEDQRALIRTDRGDLPWIETGTQALSIASQEWLRQQEECLRRLIAYCEAQPWGERVIGFMASGETTEEWFAWGSNDGFYADYSELNEAGFKAWAKEKGLPWTRLPNPEERQQPAHDAYPMDDSGRRSAAYAQYYSELTSNVVLHFCRIIKDATEGRCLTGSFGFYPVQLAGEPRQHLAAQYDLDPLIASEDLDLLAGIPLHNFRTLLNGYDTYTSVVGSILNAGKLYINENDLFSWLHHAHWYTPYDEADPQAGAIRMHERVFATDAVHGVLRQWFSLLASWHHDDALQAAFARHIKLGKELQALDRAPAEEIAFVVDDTSFAWFPPESKLPWWATIQFQYAWARTGAPLDVWLLSDVDKLPDRIKVVVVANAPAPASDDFAKLAELIKKGGRTIVLQGKSGAIAPETQTYRIDELREATGFPLDLQEGSHPGAAHLVTDGKQVTEVESLQPRMQAEGMGWLRYADGAAAGLMRDLPNGGRLIWCGAPLTDSALLRAWGEEAGIHFYAPVDFTVHAAKELVAITAPEAAEATLHWPRPVQATDVLTGWEGTGAAMDCSFEPGQTRLFKLTPAPEAASQP